MSQAPVEGSSPKPDLKPNPGSKERKRGIQDVVCLGKFVVLPEVATETAQKRPRSQVEAMVVDRLIANIKANEAKFGAEFAAQNISTWIQLAPMRTLDTTSKKKLSFLPAIQLKFNPDADCQTSQLNGRWGGQDYAIGIRFAMEATNPAIAAPSGEAGFVVLVMSKADAIIFTNHIATHPEELFTRLSELKLIDPDANYVLSTGQPAEPTVGEGGIAILSNTHLQPAHLRDTARPDVIPKHILPKKKQAPSA